MLRVEVFLTISTGDLLVRHAGTVRRPLARSFLGESLYYDSLSSWNFMLWKNRPHGLVVQRLTRISRSWEDPLFDSGCGHRVIRLEDLFLPFRYQLRPSTLSHTIWKRYTREIEPGPMPLLRSVHAVDQKSLLGSRERCLWDATVDTVNMSELLTVPTSTVTITASVTCIFVADRWWVKLYS